MSDVMVFKHGPSPSPSQKTQLHSSVVGTNGPVSTNKAFAKRDARAPLALHVFWLFIVSYGQSTFSRLPVPRKNYNSALCACTCQTIKVATICWIPLCMWGFADGNDISAGIRFRVSQTCLGTNVPSGLVPSTIFWPILGYSWGLVYGAGGRPGTVPLHNLKVTSHVLHPRCAPRAVPIRFF